MPITAFAEQEPLYDIPEELYFGRTALMSLENAESNVAAYDAIARGVKNGETTISLSDCSVLAEDIHMLIDTYMKDHPEAYTFPRTYMYSAYLKDGKQYVADLILEYYTGYDEHLFDHMANLFLDAVKDAETEYQKALMLYDILEEYVEYDYDAVNVVGPNGEILDQEALKAHSAYGAMVNGKAVCEGYSKAYQYLLQRLGIECYIVTGISKRDGGAHEWNLIKLDGHYYQTDITWDDVDSLDNIYHSYFNVTTARILEEHYIEDPYGLLPDCFDTEDVYHFENVLTSLDAVEVASLFTGEAKKIAHFYYTGTIDQFKSWWASNYNALFNNVQGLQGGISYSISYRVVGNEYIIKIFPSDYGYIIGGTFIAWGDDSSIKLELFKDGSKTPMYTGYLENHFNYWTLDNVKDGSYKLVVSKVDHKTKEYTFIVSGGNVSINSKIFPVGDVNEDGKVDIRDISRIKRYLVNSIVTDACDVDLNGDFNVYDLTELIVNLQNK